MRLLALVLLVIAFAPAAGAYAVFDEVVVQAPTWTRSDSAADWSYRVRRVGLETVVIDLRAGSGAPDGDFVLAGYQLASSPLRLRLAPNECQTVAVPLARLDQGVFAARLLPVAAAAAAAEATGKEVAFAVNSLSLDAGFNPGLVAYAASPDADGRAIDLHFRNGSRQCVHCDFAIAGVQRPRAGVNPRLHLLPGRTLEVLVPVERTDTACSRVIVDVWNARVGDDDEPAADPPAFVEIAALDEGWSPMSVVDEYDAAFAPRVLTWRRDPVGELRVRNHSRQAIVGGLRLDGAGPLLALEPVPAGGEARVDISTGTRAPKLVALASPRVDGRSSPASPPPHETPAAAERFFVDARVGVAGFHPRSIVYGIARAGDGHARVSFVNLSAAATRFRFAIASYQGDDDAGMVTVPAGGRVTATVPVKREDARLLQARIEVWDVSVGARAAAP